MLERGWRICILARPLHPRPSQPRQDSLSHCAYGYRPPLLSWLRCICQGQPTHIKTSLFPMSGVSPLVPRGGKEGEARTGALTQ